MTALNTAINLASRVIGAAGKQRLNILIFHRVLDEPDYMRPWEPTKATFSRQMEILARYFSPLSIAEALERLESGELPERAVCVTFDDGYADNEKIALPALLRWRIPATVFVATGYLDGGRMWNDTVVESIRKSAASHLDLSEFGLGIYGLETKAARLEASGGILGEIKHLSFDARERIANHLEEICVDMPDDLMLSSEGVRNLSQNGIEIGAHTVTHPILTAVTHERSQKEIVESKSALENIIDSSVDFFAYPNGKFGQDYDLSHAEIVKLAGYKAALATDVGLVESSTPRWQLPRYTPWSRSRHEFALKLLLNYRQSA